ncbi:MULTISPECIES: hypothetical protein [unclassified Methylobacterium]|uniref:hypothetical protein n=1 Tax=unclassified Methylobacterium TaxID=2615210 RepID=UPI000AB2A63C|nr:MULTISPECIES: hypothetical protein [unclassified Methylobacterium]
MIALFILGLAAAAIGPAMTILLDRDDAVASTTDTASAGMFVALNDNATVKARAAA